MTVNKNIKDRIERDVSKFVITVTSNKPSQQCLKNVSIGIETFLDNYKAELEKNIS